MVANESGPSGWIGAVAEVDSRVVAVDAGRCTEEGTAGDTVLLDVATPWSVGDVHAASSRTMAAPHMTRWRTDAGAMLGWLHTEAVIPALGEADDDYADFQINMESAQTLLAGTASSNGELDGHQRAEALDALLAVDQSPHRISLPPETLDAVRWYLEHLQR